ncbi:hypothetical protein BFJ63_vAg5985 [Fusarium oxysporum f. sp. narcissi]|uniref:F-box domain-containing protein n=4 Tax=Fusarium oxysporum TaxID=5507 RepID=A0A2H3I4K6_FUSOX|nr:uncharacterized protein FOBCDRAFT_268078 [Fusarium oxysporum Fo47]EWZ89167.1 hypothetical protein FOWG_08904 [Fusarium oxysporum f. sp. lycopersici MN25]KAJ4137047.1 hypothetical protein NW765_012308 [Fusarium oxysporum]PCD44829.1 hypothetical protein AU210_000281 [Fusarium oxysporum f. sp. radicis-cucumerinum]RKK28181.1 hypothetical protein BFJ65_g131 [Fusarium oxysporum f. sp. cepae]RYC91132.1 hypothetical protein BFJ63_vAg5985 [Fusarium oxysporum f. sp. narcissi]
MAQIQDMSYRWIYGGGSYSSTNRKLDSLLLKLPVDILLIIHSFLPTGSQLCLLTTCHGIKRLLEYTSVPFSQLPVAKKREYKMLVVRQFPNAWLTGRTLRFREFHAKDLCPQLKGPPYKDQPGWNKDTLRQFEEGALLIKHRHVQMSLKYDRLEKKPHQQKSFLKTLLEPYHTDFSPGLEMHPLDKFGAVGHFESHSKLISNRYLLFNQWTFTNPWKDRTIVLGELGRFGACEHQRCGGTLGLKTRIGLRFGEHK